MRLLRSTMRVFARDSGMTLIEAMVTLAIMCILLSLALPSMRTFVIQNRLSAETSQFIAALTLARSEAIQRGRAVLICRSIDADSADAVCSTAATGKHAAGDWGAGWLVMVGDSRKILLRQGALDDNTRVNAGKRPITYNGTGNASSSFTKVVFSHNDEFARAVCIASSGRVSIKLDGGEC
ncbi:type IV fimbrial biogenesis protein FimT [Collimonas sp. OK242]|jgi:type IV fimbrial biogenesis protein FimT|uniref:GspH/FimT family pseudopilin n=1 Tax=Collimonas sp. OK242 TaxID=1798195 RepID=UPI0008959BCC|nr:GspH/FimT family pseudopilin [Collimonas sp. OK242]SDY71654.1 type IV fimbrial biogenesis protein FimT [Collimonas sp. OK242]